MSVDKRRLPDRFPHRGLQFTSLLKRLDGISQLADGFQRKADEFQTILKMGLTQLQDAVPMTLGQEFHAFSVLLNEETKSILRTPPSYCWK